MSTHPTTAIVLDLTRNVGRSQEVRQMVIVKRPDQPGSVVSVMTRTLTPDTTGKHFRRHVTDVSAVASTTPNGWLSDQMNRYSANGYRLATTFCVEVTDAELVELSNDQTPRALAMRTERARVSVGAETFTGMPELAGTGYATLAEDVAAAVDVWLASETPKIAPAGRARKAGAAAERSTPTFTPAAGPVTPGTAKVAPGDKVVIPVNGTTYVARTMEGALSDVEMLRQGRKSGLPIIMESLPGTGKTMATMAAFGDELIMMQCNGETTADDFTGGYLPTAEAGKFTWVDGPLVQAMEEGRPLLVDEIALADPRAVSVLLSAMDGRRSINITANPLRGTVSAKEGFYVIAAYNANVPGARISEAVLSRFRVHTTFTTDYAAMETLGVPRKIIAAARNLETKRVSQEVASAPQARELISFRDTAGVFGEELALRALLTAAPEGDRDVWQDVLQRAYGRPIKPLQTATT